MFRLVEFQRRDGGSGVGPDGARRQQYHLKAGRQRFVGAQIVAMRGFGGSYRSRRRQCGSEARELVERSK